MSGESDKTDIALEEIKSAAKESGPRADIVSTKNQSAKRPFRDVLLRFASRSDKLLMAFGAFAAIGAGASLPLMTIVFGDLSDSLGRYQFKLISDSELQQVFNEKVLYFVYIGIGIAVCTYAYVGTFTYTAENCTNQLRKSYLESVLRQDITFFDHEGGGSVSTRMITDTQLVQDGTGEKVPMLIMNMSTFVIAFIIAFYHSWQLTIVLICCIPVMIAYMAFFRKYVVLFTRRNLEQYALAGNVAEEALGAVRTLTAFMAQNKLAERYRKYLIGAEKEGIKIQLLYGSIFGFMPFVLYSVYALGFYYGGQLLLDDKITPGDILTCFMAIAIGTFSIAGSSGEIQAIGFAVGAAGALFDTIDRVPSIDPYSKKGLCPEKVEGKIKVENVTFRYPSRPDVVAVKNMNLEIDAGSTVALVGSSGSGKSTLVQLIERFYDPEQGRILLDGTDLKDLNVLWLRQQIGYVTQEPILFKAKIWENVAHGLIGTPLENASKEEQLKVVIQACKDANAHDFITKLPDQYDTAVGERGLLLSGGQKQRIAIARAIAKNPRILLLDEATSALDTHSEKVVQEALDHAASGRTTIVIAHRLSTIRNADKIVVMDRGDVIEVGTHKSLTAIPDGFYRRLVEGQEIKQAVQILPESKKVDPDIIQGLGTLTEIKVERPVEYAKEKRFEGSLPRVMWEVFLLNRPELTFILAGAFASAVAGAIMPVFAFIFGSILEVFYKRGDALRADTEFWSLMFFVIAFIGLFSNFLKFYFFGTSGEKLTTRLRDQSFQAMLHQEIGWFDEERNSVGALTSSLSSSAQQVQNMSGTVVGSLVELSASIIGAAIISLITGWKLALVALACLPLLIAANKMRIDMMRRGNVATKEHYEKSAQVACEAVGAMRTIASLTRERDVFNMYSLSLVEPLRIGHHHAYVGSLLFAVSQSFTFMMNAVVFYYGSQLFMKDGYDIRQMFTVLMASTFAGQSSGRVFSLFPDLTKSQIYACDILTLLARQPRIKMNEDKEKLDPATVEGHVEFKNVYFEYPTRPGIRVLKGLNMTVKPGQFVALVGSSGCGKSTTVGLMERFYDVTGGSVLLDGKNIETLNLPSVRRVTSMVGQEPSLFAGSIRENILLGREDENAVTQQQIEDAAKEANIHDFIMTLPDGYNTDVGTRGSQLSGGQKQRVAIARSLIMRPKLLLLDEATSALDATSEKVVQAALDQAAKGRTTIAIAHRLSTIKTADCIYVFQNGVVIEHGTHDELMAMGGLYQNLAAQQDLNS